MKEFMSLAIAKMAKDAGFSDVSEGAERGDGVVAASARCGAAWASAGTGGGFGRRLTT